MHSRHGPARHRAAVLLTLALLAVSACSETEPASSPAASQRQKTPPAAAGVDDAIAAHPLDWPVDTGKVEWPIIKVWVTDVGLREAAKAVATQAQLGIQNPEALPDKTITLHFDAVSSRSVIAVIAREARMRAIRVGDTVRFERVPGSARS